MEANDQSMRYSQPAVYCWHNKRFNSKRCYIWWRNWLKPFKLMIDASIKLFSKWVYTQLTLRLFYFPELGEKKEIFME